MGGWLGGGTKPQQQVSAPVSAPVDTSASDKLDAERKRRAKLAARAETLLSSDGAEGKSGKGSLLGG
jgi:hypothetical protein